MKGKAPVVDVEALPGDALSESWIARLIGVLRDELRSRREFREALQAERRQRAADPETARFDELIRRSPWGTNTLSDAEKAELEEIFARRAEQYDAKIAERNKFDYTDDNEMENMAAYLAAARNAKEKGLSVAELQEAIEAKLAEKAASREITARARAAPRLDDAEKTLAAKLAVIEDEARERVDGTLLELVHRYAEMRESIELPADGLKTLDQARFAALLSTTFSNLQARLQKYGLEPLPRDPRVVEARRQSSSFYRRERVKKPSDSALKTAAPG